MGVERLYHPPRFHLFWDICPLVDPPLSHIGDDWGLLILVVNIFVFSFEVDHPITLGSGVFL